MENPSLSRRSPPSTRKSRKPLQHPNPEWKSDRILAPSPDGWNIMKEGIPHDYVNKKIIRKHLTRERINIHTDFHNGHPGHSQYLASYIAKTRSRWKRVIYGFQNTPTMVKLRIKCMRHSAISSPVIRFQKLKDAIYHNYIPSRNSPNTTLSKRIGWMKIVTEKIQEIK